jgi:uncharacterized protein (AIM24 family)
MLLLTQRKTIQSNSGAFLFHTAVVSVGTEVRRKKNLFFTGFAHHNLRLWKSRGNQLPNPPAANQMSFSN